MHKVLVFVVLLLSGILAQGQTFNFNKQIKGFGQIPNQIYSIEQDKKGYIWISTNRGIQYSDGISSYQIPDSISTEFTGIEKIWVDADGLVWIYQANKAPKIYHFDLQTWVKIPLDLPELKENNPIPKIDFFTSGKEKSKLLFLVYPGKIIKFNQYGENPTYISTENLGNYFSSFISGKDSVFLYEKGVYRLEGNLLSPQPHVLTENGENFVKLIHVPSKNKFYFLTDKGLYEGPGINEISKAVYKGFRGTPVNGNDVYNLFLNGEELYFYFNSQLFQYNMLTRRGVEVPVYNDLRIKQISAAKIDREGIIWVGGFRGLANLASLRFQNFEASSGLANPDISAAILTKRHHYLLGFENGIQFWVGSQSKKTYYLSEGDEPDQTERVLNFSQDSDGNIWFSAFHQGLGYFHVESETIELFDLPGKIPVNYVMAEDDQILVAGNDKIFQASLPRAGVKPNFKPLDINLNGTDSLGFIRKIGKSGEGKLVIVIKENRNTDGYLDLEDATIISGFDYLERSDTLLVGTHEGLKYEKDGKLISYEVDGQEINYPVYSILKDGRNNIWLGTDSGVFLLEKGRLRVFNESNGLIGNDISRGGLVETDRGRILIGSQNGVSVYIPSEDKGPPVSPGIILEKVSVVDVEGVEFDFPNIPYQLNNIVCHYSAASFTHSPSLIISYKLEGFHTEWQKIENPRTNGLYFNNLPPGNYRLAIMANFQGLPPSDTVYSSEFNISYPYYFQAWFILLVFIFLIGLGVGINMLFRQYKNQLLLKMNLDRTTSQIKSREDQFRNVWNSSQDGLMLSVISGKVIAANPSLCKLGNVSEDELRQLGIQHLFSDPEYYPKVRDKMAGDLKAIGTEGFTIELRMPFRTGERDIELFITRMNEDIDGLPFFLSMFRDITKDKNYEQGLKFAKEKAEELSKLKSNILSNMSHEVRTPLTGILGSTENIIYSRKQDTELVGQMEIIKESGERLLKTINNIMDLSLIEADKINIVLENTNVNDFISKILINHKSQGIKKGILVTAKFLTKPFIASVERKYLEMIINNIVGNSVKYSEKGIVQVLVKRENDHFYFQVKDEGIGISENYLNRLFHPFEQESEGLDRKFEGSGIGLAITKHLVEILYGNIKIESEKGKGTTVTITLPLEG
ncbi:MAG: ATP-binding protein [Cyclobacteriaceae bacterium]